MIKSKEKIILIGILVISLLFGFYRIYPYFFSGIPFGYDPGIYRDFMMASFGFLPNIDLGGFVPWIRATYEPGWWLLSNVLWLVWYHVDWILLRGVGILSLITSLFIYKALKKYGTYAWFLGMILFWISIIQYQTFWRCYIKQIIGILLLLSVFSLFESKKYLISIPLLLMLFVTNRPGGIFFLAVFAVLQLVSWIRKRKIEINAIWAVLCAWILALIVYIPVIHEQILSMLDPMFGSIFIPWTSGTFFATSEFLKYDILFLLLSFWGLFVKIKKKERDWITIGYLVWAWWMIFWLFFFSRIAIFWDIFIILLGAYGLASLFQTHKKIFWWIFGGFWILQSIRYLHYVRTVNFPLIDQTELEKIIQINTLIPQKSIIMTTNKKYSAFVQWRTDKNIIAPWLFDIDAWDQNTWNLWHRWDGAIKCQMMEKEYANIDMPIYLWLGKYQPVENLEHQNCFDIIENGGTYLILKRKNPKI